jgi:hypothetical protein
MLERMELIKYEKRQSLLILKMSKLFRTEEDLAFLARYFKDYKAFQNVSPDMMHHLCAIMTSVEYEPYQTGLFVAINIQSFLKAMSGKNGTS